MDTNNIEIDVIEEDSNTDYKDSFGFNIISNNNLMGIELMGIANLRRKMQPDDIILKSLITKRIEIYSSPQAKEIIEHGDARKFRRIY